MTIQNSKLARELAKEYKDDKNAIQEVIDRITFQPAIDLLEMACEEYEMKIHMLYKAANEEEVA